MSDSIHHTLKSVFGGKSKAEIQRMIDEDDPDLLELLRKRGIKKRVRDVRQLAALIESPIGTPDEPEAAD
jgi:hypothetical protein